MEILDLEHTMNKLKILIKNFNNRLHQAKEGTYERKDRSFKIIQSEEQMKKRMKKSEEILRNLWTNKTTKINMHIIGVP